jgi:hypothetical protein
VRTIVWREPVLPAITVLRGRTAEGGEDGTMGADSFRIERVSFPSVVARLVRVGPQASTTAVVDALRVPTDRPVIVVNGGTATLVPDERRGLAEMLEAVVVFAVRERAILVTGGTDAGVFELLGDALARVESGYVCIGVVPTGVTTWPGKAPEPPADEADVLVPLEPHHTHFVAVNGRSWGDETATLLRLTATLSERTTSVGVLAGGGDIAGSELAGHLRASRPVVVLSGSGRLADRVTSRVGADGPDIRGLDEVAGREHLIVLCGIDDGPAVLRDQLRRLLEERQQ